MSSTRRLTHAPAEGARFRGLLVMCFVLLFALPIAEERFLGTRLLVVLFYAMLLSALFGVARTRNRWLIGVGLIATSIAFAALGWRVAADVLSVVFLSYCGEQMLRYVMSRGPVTTDKLLASLCVYMLMAFVWAEVYTTIEHHAPGSFSGLVERESPADALPIGVELTYFSFVTQTTLGYGDISPAGNLARTLAIVQAVTAHLYLTVLVARLVALHITTSNVVDDPRGD